jgi:CheY-like chemotaxis protein
MKTILLAEDSPDDEIFFTRVLRAAGVRNPVRVVRDGVEAIAYFEGRGPFSSREDYPLPDVLFLDLKMPRLNGWEVLTWLKSRPNMNKMLVVVLTQLDDAKDLYDAYALGANSFLIKPFIQLDLEDLIQSFPGHWEFDDRTPRKLRKSPFGGMLLV